ncbi:MAG: helix-turn-helix domain-containing protein, partial [Thermoplasmataceae archaeon]
MNDRVHFNTVSGKSHILQGWDESEPISSYIITTSISDHEEIRGGSEFHMIRTYRFRIYPDSAQIHTLESSLNLSCELYNAMLQQRIYAYRSKKKVNYRTQQNEIPDIK